LASAAGIATLGPAQAAPVEYVKICSLYGAGFYYIPGTDICMKIGGYVRYDMAYGTNGDLNGGAFSSNFNNPSTNNVTLGIRGYITADSRQQTEYGTLRSYLSVGLNTNTVSQDTAANTFSSNRAFIQWAGFTFGLAQSFYDFYSVPATAYWGSYPASDTGEAGWAVAGYTFQFGNGWSATVAAEQRRATQIIIAGNGPGTIEGSTSAGNTGFPGAGYGGWQVPDLVANARVDQTWGSAQIMGALHQVNSLYFNGFGPQTGHPGDKWGFAVGGGVKINTPAVAPNDFFQGQVNYAQGASRYIMFTPEFNYGYRRGSNAAYGILTDAVVGGQVATGNTTDLNLTTSWGVNLAYEHFWNPAWRTSIYGGYAAISYGTLANALLCQSYGQGTGAGSTVMATPGCNNNWSTNWVGSRTQWNVNRDFYLGVDVVYQHLMSAQSATGIVPISFGAIPEPLTVKNQDNWSFRFRAHRDFVP